MQGGPGRRSGSGPARRHDGTRDGVAPEEPRRFARGFVLTSLARSTTPQPDAARSPAQWVRYSGNHWCCPNSRRRQSSSRRARVAVARARALARAHGGGRRDGARCRSGVETAGARALHRPSSMPDNIALTISWRRRLARLPRVEGGLTLPRTGDLRKRTRPPEKNGGRDSERWRGGRERERADCEATAHRSTTQTNAGGCE